MADRAALRARVIAGGGGSASERDLPAEVFGRAINVPLMHQAVTAQLAAARSGTASTKKRSEVRGGGAKPWRQKGTGRARHGSIRSPIWTGGGVVFGPKPRDFSVRLPKKMRKGALRSALAAKAGEGAISILEDWSEPRTKAAARILADNDISGRVLIVLDPSDESSIAIDRAFRNLDGAAFSLVGSLSTYDVLVADHVIFSAVALDRFVGGGADQDEVSA